MISYRCPKCGAAFGEGGFCPHDGTKLIAGAVVDRPPPSVEDPFSDGRDEFEDSRTRTVPQHQPDQQSPSSFDSQPPSGMFRSMSAAENTADALQAFHANAAALTEYDRLVGQTLDGRYHIVKKLGEGGMGVVFAARHAVIERPLAVKVLKREVMRDTATIKRFVQEAKAASRIGHPNIVDVTDFGTTPDGMTYQVMEFVDGVTLGAAIKAGAPFKPSRSIRIAAQIARALGAAHDKGIVHRDLKPENIFLVDRDGRRDFVKIVDFGIAKVTPVEGAVAEGPRLTRAGAVFGTPEYMAPEQAAGRSDTDGRADIYALGIILYEMTVGKVPHKGDTMVRTLAMQMLDPPIPPSKARPDQQIPPDFEATILKALSKKREQRYQTMAELLSDLERAAGQSLNEPVSTSVSAARAFTLAPLPPGADAARVRSAPPSMPLLESRSRRPSAPMSMDAPGAVPAVSTGGDNRISAPMSAQTPSVTGDGNRGHSQPGISITGDTNRLAPRRMRNEPEFVSSARPVVMVDHDNSTLVGAKSTSARWPWLVMAGLFAAGMGVMIAVTLHAPKTKAVVTAVVEDHPDARQPPAPILDAQVVIVDVPPDSRLAIDSHEHTTIHNNTSPNDHHKDAGVPSNAGSGSDGTDLEHHYPGEINAIQIITKPDGGMVYLNDSYRGPSGTTIQETFGTKMTVKCQMAGYSQGELELTWDGKVEVVLCVMKRVKRCIDALKNPFDDCPNG